MAYEYKPPPGPPLDPSKYNGVIGPNGQQYGEQQGFVYNPVTDKYDPKPKDDKQQSLSSYIGPVAAGAGAIAAGTLLGDPTKWPSVGTAVSDSVSGLGNVFGMGGAAAPAAAAPAASAAAPAAASAAAPFAMGAAPAAGAVPAAPTLVSATATPTAAAAPFSLGGAALQAGGIAAGAATGYEQFQNFNHLAHGEKPSLLEAAASFPVDFGASIAANLFGFGHGKNYYAAKDREGVWDKLTGGSGVLTFERADGTPYTITKEQFAKNKDVFNYDQSSGSMPLDIGVGNTAATLLGFKPGSKIYTDVAGTLANAHRNGVNPDQVFGKLGLPTGHDQLYGQVILDEKAGKISKEHADQAKNALDQVFQVGFYAGGKSPEKASGPSANINTVASSPAPSSGGGAVKPVGTGPQRVSPGVYKDAQGTFNSKTGVRGK